MTPSALRNPSNHTVHTQRNSVSLIAGRLALALALVAPFALASCGGSDSGGVTTPTPVVTRIDVSAPTTTLAPAQTVKLTSVARSASGAAVAGSESWSSSSNAVATVSGSGLVTAVAAGTVTITASRGSVSGTVSLTVIPAGGTVVTLNVALSDPSLVIGDQGQGTVSARDANNAAVALGSRTITWSSSNTSIATVSSSGVIAAVGIGSTVIRASVQEGGSAVVGNATLNVVANPDAKQNVDVSMPGLTFSPADMVVKVGGTVRFIFPNLAHNVIWRPRLTGSPVDILPVSNTTITQTFTTAGVFPFVCTLHDGMVGTVVVSP